MILSSIFKLHFFIVMKIHLIAIGGSAMHNLAIALKQKRNKVTGSDDKIFSPSKERLEKQNLLPEKTGWDPSKITKDIDIVIVGMHAKEDNPELLKAIELNLKIFSYPEYIYEHSKDKKRIVIGGSHGKTSITAMILHVLKRQDIDCDFMVGAQLDGFENMVRLTKNAPYMIIEGDEYLSSPIDRRPKFHLYHPHIAVLSGIAWDHINVFPTFEIYIEQFRLFKNMVRDTLIYCQEDNTLKKLVSEDTNCKVLGYTTHENKVIDGITYVENTKLQIFGNHNLQNLNAAKLVCKEIGIKSKVFYAEIASFKGASNRLELVYCNKNTALYKDFAHSPSKLKATSKAMKEQFKNRKLVACMELHTFSSLDKEFLTQYKGCMNDPDISIVYFNPKAIAHKGLNLITKENIKKAFEKEDLKVFNSSCDLKKFLNTMDWENQNLLMMSSGNFNNINLKELILL